VTDDEHDELQDVDIQALEALAEAGAELDPRPVFPGDWSAAQGFERTAHMRLVKAWKERHGLLAVPTPSSERQTQASSGSAQQTGDTATVRAVALAILNDPDALDTSRIAAGKLLVQADPDARSHGHSSAAEVWRARAQALELLPLDQRLAFLTQEVHGTTGSADGFERQEEAARDVRAEKEEGGHPSARASSARDSAGTSRPQDLHPAHP
jgi:hypothetical protein